MKWGWGSISEDGQDLDINVANQNSHVLYTTWTQLSKGNWRKVEVFGNPIMHEKQMEATYILLQEQYILTKPAVMKRRNCGIHVLLMLHMTREKLSWIKQLFNKTVGDKMLFLLVKNITFLFSLMSSRACAGLLFTSKKKKKKIFEKLKEFQEHIQAKTGHR